MPPASLSAPEAAGKKSHRKRVALVGMPNTGKSTFFNRLTGASARTGNWPGVTVDLLSARLILGPDIVEIVDLPGIYDLRGFSEDEEVVRRFLGYNSVDLVIIVVNSVQIERQLHLACQLKAVGLPAMLVLNMQDEADTLGISIDRERLGRELGLPVIQLSAKKGQGMGQVSPTLIRLLGSNAPPHIDPDLLSLLPPDKDVKEQVQRACQAAVHIPVLASEQLSSKLDRVLLHPWLGLPLFFFIMFLVFEGVYLCGAPLQDGMGWVLDAIKVHALAPLLAPLPTLVSGFLLEGLWGGLATVASFVPIIVLFFLFMALVEDTGYFSRAAYLMDSFMARLGLDGRSFVMVLMGFGCNVPALMGTRVMRSRALRLLTMFIIPFSLCSARLQVFLFLISILFSPLHAGLVLFSLYLMSVATAIFTALVFKRWFPSREPFILEMPPYRLPTVRMMWLRGWQEVRHFLTRATKFITLGVVLVWALTHLPPGVDVASQASWAGQIGSWFKPVLDPIGINTQMAIALIFGFVAKEIVVGSLAVIFGLQGHALDAQIAGSMDWVQGYSFMLFTLIYTPCLSTVATIYTESRSRWFTALTVVWALGLAWVVSWGFFHAARALGY
jgi:ferrous iron transport protein B